MPTPDRTTIKAVIQQFVALLRANLAAEPPSATRPFRRIEFGELDSRQYARPCLGVKLLKARPFATTEGDKVFEVSMELRLTTDVVAADPHDAVLDKIGAVEDCLDGLMPGGVLEGVEGFDDRVWTIDYSKQSSGSRVAMATALQSFVVKVQRGQNRVPG